MARTHLPLFPTHDGSSSRANITCLYKCGDACSQSVPNTSGGTYFGDVVRTSLTRRGVLRGGAMAVLAVGAGGALAGCADDSAAASSGAEPTAGPRAVDLGPAATGTDFAAVAPNTDDAVTVPDGYESGGRHPLGRCRSARRSRVRHRRPDGGSTGKAVRVQQRLRRVAPGRRVPEHVPARGQPRVHHRAVHVRRLRRREPHRGTGADRLGQPRTVRRPGPG